MNRVILASHGDLALGMKQTIGMLSGQTEIISAYGLHEGESVKDICKMIENEMDEAKDDNFTVITDLPGGSVNNELLGLLKEKNNFQLITGMNVMLVLNLVLEGEVDQAVITECIEGAQSSIQYFDIADIENNKDEEVDFFD